VLAGILERLDLLLLAVRERHTNPAECRDALDRVVQRLAQLDGGRLGVLTERGGHVGNDMSCLIEDLVAAAGSRCGPW
jgi:hypothetical protein